MRMRIIALSLVVFIFTGVEALAGENIAGVIKAVVVRNMQATEAEDFDAMMGTIHTRSPLYFTTRQQMPAVFKNFDIKYELLYYRYIGSDGPYAVARVKQRAHKVSGPAFRNNILDMIQVFRREGSRWKYWSQTILKIQYTR